MALPGNKNFSDYDNYVTDQNPTTSAQAQDYFRNQAELLKAVIDCDFWQPETVYQPGDVVKSDSMPNGTEAVMVATKASVTSNVEPQWGAVGGANISDGACFWKLRYKTTVTDETADYPLRNKAYSLNAIVACPYHANLMLKCTKAGTTSANSLDTSGATNGKTYTDGGVTWTVIKDFNANDTIPIANGGTGATNAADALYNLGGYSKNGGEIYGGIGITNGDVNNGELWISKNNSATADYGANITDGNKDGNRITVTLSANGKIFELHDRDIDKRYTILTKREVSAHIIETGGDSTQWYRKYSDGWCEQGGSLAGENYNTPITLLVPFKDTKYYVAPTCYEENAGEGNYSVTIRVGRKQTTSVQFGKRWNGSAVTNFNDNDSWYACGYYQ